MVSVLKPEKDHVQSDAPMAADGDRHADDGDDECDQLNRTNDHEPDDNMSNDDDDANRDDNDRNDKDDDDDDDDAEVALNGGDVPVRKSCGNFGHRTHRDHRCPNHQCDNCGEQGHTKRFCPDVQCPRCDLFGHVNKKDCKYKHCINVEVDWLNISIVINRLQFPLRLAYAMTFNKLQGQHLENVLIDGTAQHLPARGSINGAFMHGHCIVALR